MAKTRDRQLPADDDRLWARCNKPGCDNRVHPARALSGYLGCIELHSGARKEFVVIDLPKSGATVGTLKDLKQIATSHKSGVDAEGGEAWYITRPIREDQMFKVATTPTQTTEDALLHKLKTTQPKSNGRVYLTGNKGLGFAYRLGWTKSRSEPAELTDKGELARQIALRGRRPSPL